MPKRGKPENLNPLPTQSKDKQREIRSKGGKASGEARRKKKLMSQIYGAFLAEKFAVKIGGVEQTLTGEKLVNRVVKEVLVRGGAPAVSLMKEIREATEGSKLAVTGPISIGLPPEPSKRAPDA